MRPTITFTVVTLAFVLGGGCVTNVSAKTKVRHHRHAAQPRQPAYAQDPAAQPSYARGPFAEARDPDRFYPNEIEGGVRGNLSFNNQLRKLSDPLNANGGGG